MGCKSKSVVAQVLSLFYSVLMLFQEVYRLFSRNNFRFWVVNERPEPPECLQKHGCGESKFIMTNGIRMHYIEKGDRSNPLMVLVHGFPEFWFSWRHQIEEFSKDYWVVAIDLRGYGESSKPRALTAYSITNMVHDLHQLVTRLDS